MATLNTSKLSLALSRHAEIADAKFRKTHPHAATWMAKRGMKPSHIRHHAGRLATAGALAGAMLLANPVVAQVATHSAKIASLPKEKLQEIFGMNLRALLPTSIHPLTAENEESIAKLIQITWGIRATALLHGEHLNTTYGYIGAEQHLPRFPGDTVTQHSEYQDAGMTPGKGAWGYFANSQSELTDDLIQKEKYYVAVQTLYLPDWTERLTQLRDWYKYRKVMVANPISGKSIIAAVADAGPALSTGKQFGGSPEVMAYLESRDGAQKGPVVLFFVDDPENKIPLGPMDTVSPEADTVSPQAERSVQ